MKSTLTIFIFLLAWYMGFVQAQTLQVCPVAGSYLKDGFVDGTRTAARFTAPHGIAVDAAGNIYVSEEMNHSIRKITPEGVVTTLAGNGKAGFADGIGAVAQFNAPGDIEVDDASGSLYVSDYNNHRIRKVVLATGEVSTLAGSTQGFADGIGSAAKFNLIGGLALDGAGNLYVSDYVNNRIRKIVLATGAVSTFAGSGAFATLDGVGTAANIKRPWGLATDGAGNLYVGELSGHTIRKIVIATATVTTLAGSGIAGFANGTGTAAQFNEPRGITVDGAGNVYLTEFLSHHIRKITPAGVVTTFAGTNTSGSADGTPETARFNLPSGIFVNPAGNLFYVADVRNYSIRKIALGASTSETMAWTGWVNTTLNNACNWSPYGIPTATNPVTISNETNKPLINDAVPKTAKQITLNAGSSLSLNVNTMLNLSAAGVWGIDLKSGASLTNDGTINITDGLGISVGGGTLNNRTCAKLIMTAGDYDNSVAGSMTTNTGLIQIANNLNTSGQAFTNNGVLVYGAVNGTITNNQAGSLIVNNKTLPIFTYGGTYNGTINGIYKDAAATLAAGTFTAPNTFKSPGLPLGLQTLYTKITPSGGVCSYTVPFTFDKVPSIANEADAPEIIGAFVLTEVYPNPFNPTATFTLAVAQTQNVQIRMFDLLGREVKLLHNGHLDGQTTHTFSFNAQGLVSGKYLLRVQGENFAATKTLTLVK